MSANVNQQQMDGSLTVVGMATQLGINVGIAIVVFQVFSIFRTRYTRVYSPVYETANEKKKPPTPQPGYLSWFNPVMHAKDEDLLETIGYDAVFFLRFIRMLRKLLLWMTLFGICILIPINIIATRLTGDWPPGPGVDFLSIATINYKNNQYHPEGNLGWYAAHAIGTWFFSGLIYWTFYVNYRSNAATRQDYFASDEYQNSLHARTLLITNVPSNKRTDEKLRKWVEHVLHRAGIKYPIDKVKIGQDSSKLQRYVEHHEEAVRKLEEVLVKYQDGKRPIARIGGHCWGYIGGKKVDGIQYYSERVASLREGINRERTEIRKAKPTTFGWITFQKVSWAHETTRRLEQHSNFLTRSTRALQTSIELAPRPKDIVWSNLALNMGLRHSKGFGTQFIFYAFAFLWFIPSTAILTATSNLKDIIRLFPNSGPFLQNNAAFISLVSSWVSPLVMAVFFSVLPKILRYLSRQQGVFTSTSLDRQVFAKLYLFFIINNLLIFTVSSTLIQLYSQIHTAIQGQEANTAEAFYTTLRGNLIQVAKNLSDMSTFWVNYVSLKGLGVVMELAQLGPLAKVLGTNIVLRPTLRQRQESTHPIDFEYDVFYNVIVFFFTVGLVYSVVAPLVLPFTLIYFLLATMVFRYLLMYVFVTRVETGGQMWRILFNRLLVSVLLFQVVMIGVLNLKNAKQASCSLIPLPILTLIFKAYCHYKFDGRMYYYRPAVGEHDVGPSLSRSDSSFENPAVSSEPLMPMIHTRMQALLPRLYGASRVKSEKRVYPKQEKKVRHPAAAIEMPKMDKGAPSFQMVEEAEPDVSQLVSPMPPAKHRPRSKAAIDPYASTRPLLHDDESENTSRRAGPDRDSFSQKFVFGKAFRGGNYDTRDEPIQRANLYLQNQSYRDAGVIEPKDQLKKEEPQEQEDEKQHHHSVRFFPRKRT